MAELDYEMVFPLDLKAVVGQRLDRYERILNDIHRLEGPMESVEKTAEVRIETGPRPGFVVT